MQDFPHHYRTKAVGEAGGNVVVSGKGLPALDTQAPPEFGGPEGMWSPESMLSACVANCFILSFRAIARASKFEWNSLECNVDGVLERPERTTIFTRFNIQAVLHVPSGAKIELGRRLLEKAEKICLITASLKSETVLTCNVQVD